MHFIPRVSNYCGCISLKTGALILAWFGTVGSFIGLMFIIVAITMGVDVIVNVVRDIEVKNTTLIDLGLATFADEDEKFHILHLIVTVVLLSMLAFSLWAFIVNFLLLIGAHNNKPALVGQWLISALVWMAINFVEAVYTIGVYSKIHSDADSVRMITIIVSTVLRLVIFMYWWICIYSFYHSIKYNKTSLNFKRHQDEYDHRCNRESVDRY